MVQYMQFAQMFMVWIGRWGLESDILGFETWICHILITMFHSNKVLPGASWKWEYLQLSFNYVGRIKYPF